MESASAKMGQGKTVGKILSPSEIAKLQRDYLNEKPEQVKRDIETIRQWILAQPHLGENAKSDDKFILTYLRGCKFSYERTKEKIDTWHSVRTHCPEFFNGWDVERPELMELLDIGMSIPLKGYDKEGRKVLVMKPSDADNKRHPIEDRMKVLLITNDLFMHFNDDLQAVVKGVVVISDNKGVDAALMKSMTPSLAKKCIVIFQDGYPSNPKENHLVNIPSFMEKFAKLMLSFASQKMRDRSKFHARGSSYKELHKSVGKDVLPQEYGGNAGPIKDQVDKMKEFLLSNKTWIREQERFKSDESKRVKPRGYADIFGMEGSFRQLEFD